MVLKDSNKKLNIPFAIVEHSINAITMFVVYKIVIKFLGLDILGLWSILLAIVSLTSIGTAGFASSAVKYVSKYIALKEEKSLIAVIETTFFTVLLISILMLTFISIGVFLLKHNLFSLKEISEINVVYPYLLASFILGFSSSVFLSVLDGLNLIYIRSLIGIFSKLIFLTLAILLLKDYGLKGLAIALLVQNITLLISSALLLKSQVKGLNIFLLRFNKIKFLEIFKYGYQFQIISIFQMLVDPFTKFLLKNYGGLLSVGYFELIYKFLFHARQMIVVALNTFIPTVASMVENQISNINEKFKFIFSFTFIISIMLLTLVFSFFPLLVNFVNLEMNGDISFYSTIVYIGLLFNLFAVAPFVFNLGIGNLKINLISTSLMGVLNIFLSSILGYFFLSKGVLVGWMLAQVISSIVLILYFFKNQNLNFKNIIFKDDIFLLGAILLSLIILAYINNYYTTSLAYSILINTSVPFLIVLYPIIKNKKFQVVKIFTLNKLRK